jgi:short-subunit dehydrogenase
MDQDGSMPRALITGPTSGIGQGFARALAAQGHDLVLVSRDQARLQALATDVQRDFGVSSTVISADLTNREDIEQIAAVVQSDELDVLVNNAGFGVKGGFLDTSWQQEQEMIDVLITAVMQLTHAALPGMVDRGRGYVFTISSVAGWITGGTYSAAKSWATVFTEGLAVELAGTGVQPVAVCPGFTHTEFHQRAGMQMDSVSDWMWLNVDDVVSQALRDARAGRVISVAGQQYKALSTLLRVLPRSLVRRATGVRQTSSRFPQSR